MSDIRNNVLAEVAKGLQRIYDELDADSLHNMLRFEGKFINLVARWNRKDLNIALSGLRDEPVAVVLCPECVERDKEIKKLNEEIETMQREVEDGDRAV